jgi:hypothetical protein
VPCVSVLCWWSGSVLSSPITATSLGWPSAVVSDHHHFFHHYGWLDPLALSLLPFRFLQLASQVSHLLSQASPLLLSSLNSFSRAAALLAAMSAPAAQDPAQLPPLA